MLLARRNQDLMPSMFNELLNWNNWNNDLMCETSHATPKMNVSETDNDYRLELCVPGLKKEDLNLTVDNENNLVIELIEQKENTNRNEDRHWLRHEFSRMQFKQILALPDNVKRENISARVSDGILYVDLPKITEKEKKALSHTIAIS